LARRYRYSRYFRYVAASHGFANPLESAISLAVVADEDVDRLHPDPAPEMSAFIWFVAITDESRPVPVSSFQVDGLHGTRNPDMTGCHQPVETITGSDVPVAWFSQGLRIIDFSNPMRSRPASGARPSRAQRQPLQMVRSCYHSRTGTSEPEW
jgi:hypothetical protein